MHSTRSTGARLLSAHDRLAVNTGADPSDLQCVSDEVLEHAMAVPSRCARGTCPTRQERTSEVRTRVLRGHGTLAAAGSAHDARQGYASTSGSQRLLANSTASKSQCVLTRGICGDSTAGILERARAAPRDTMRVEGSVRGATRVSSDLASTLGERLSWEVERVRRMFRD